MKRTLLDFAFTSAKEMGLAMNRADYWKSQPRKFCDFCKCWISDNKPSVEFHERGKRHKENVQKKIDELRKRSGEREKEKDDMKEYLAQMERDALEAVKRDLAKDPSLAAQYGVKLKSAESVWETPEGFVSLAEQEGLVEQTPENTQQMSEAAEGGEENTEEEPSPKKFRVDSVGTRGAAYGAWETIREDPASDSDPEPKPVPKADPPSLEDIPLPADPHPMPDPHSNWAPQPKMFKEKTIGSLGPSSGASVGFKKRKVASSARNARQRQ